MTTAMRLKRTYTLQPFHSQSAVPFSPFSLTARIEREAGRIKLEYFLKGDRSGIHFPERLKPGSTASRMDELWKHTCFEAFIGLESDAGYWEINLSPSGHWNLYRLTGYRQGLSPEPDIAEPRISITESATEWRLESELELPEAARSAAWDVSLTAVLESKSGDCSFWAYRHAARQPDFHHRGAFVRLE